MKIGLVQDETGDEFREGKCQATLQRGMAVVGFDKSERAELRLGCTKNRGPPSVVCRWYSEGPVAETVSSRSDRPC